MGHLRCNSLAMCASQNFKQPLGNQCINGDRNSIAIPNSVRGMRNSTNCRRVKTSQSAPSPNLRSRIRVGRNDKDPNTPKVAHSRGGNDQPYSNKHTQICTLLVGMTAHWTYSNWVVHTRVGLELSELSISF